MPSSAERSYDYLMSSLPPATMTREQEAELSARALTGDIDAANALAEGHMRFGMTIARRYHRRHPGVPLSDFVSAALLGLLRAAKTFDHTRGARFISYAHAWSEQQCRLELANMSAPVRLPPSVSQGMLAVKGYYAQPQNVSRSPHTADADAVLAFGGKADSAKSHRSFVESAIVSQHCHRSLDDSVHAADHAGLTHKDRLTDPAADPCREAETKSVSELVEQMLSALPAREQFIARRYFLGDDEGNPVSLEDISHEIGVTRERVRQLKNIAVDAMRDRWGVEVALLIG